MSGEQRTYSWQERSVSSKNAPKGQVWVAREMFSYTSDIPGFTSHLQAMAEGLDQAHYTEYDPEDHDEYSDPGHFVVGLRPITDEDRAVVDWQEQQAEKREREELVAARNALIDALQRWHIDEHGLPSMRVKRKLVELDVATRGSIRNTDWIDLDPADRNRLLGQILAEGGEHGS